MRFTFHYSHKNKQKIPNHGLALEKSQVASGQKQNFNHHFQLF